MLMVVSVIVANTCTVTRERRERSKLTDERKRNYGTVNNNLVA